jgi:hypothetical protein
MSTLPTDGKARKEYPIGDGCIAYFPAAIAGVARHSYIAGAKYNKGGLTHNRWQSADHVNCIERHLMDMRDLQAARDRGVTSSDVYIYNFQTEKEELVTVPIEQAILIEANALAWRSLAVSQILHECLGGAPLAPAARAKAGDVA